MAQQLEAITILQNQLLATQAVITTLAVAPTPVAVLIIVEVALPPKFNGERSQVVGFVNTCCLFMQMRLTQVVERNKISWVLSYVQEGEGIENTSITEDLGIWLKIVQQRDQ